MSQPLEELAAEPLERQVDDLAAELPGQPPPAGGRKPGADDRDVPVFAVRNAAASSRSSSVSVKSSRGSDQMSGIGRGGKMNSAPPYSAWAIPGPTRFFIGSVA